MVFDTAMVEGIIFDLYDTLVYLDTERFYAGRGELAGILGVSPDEFSRFWRKHLDRRFSGEIPHMEAMLDLARAEIGVNTAEADRAEMEEIERKSLRDSVFTYAGVEKMLSDLRNVGNRLALLSNVSYTWYHVEDKFPWLRHFHHLVLSFQVGMIKPDPAIYFHTLDKMGLSPAQCLFVGDGGSRELDGAKEAGLTTVKVVQEYQDPSFERSINGDYVIESITDLPKLLNLLNGGKDDEL